MAYNYETPFPPKVYDGPPPSEWGMLINGDYWWRCECGTYGVSSNSDWVYSDVNRHRQNGNHEEFVCDPA